MPNAIFSYIVICGAFSIEYIAAYWGWRAEIPALPMASIIIFAIFVRQWLVNRETNRRALPVPLLNSITEDRAN
jgi:CHASE2 domain-containing sensor protein